VHGEVTDPEVDLFDREAVFIDRVMQPLRRDFPALKVVFEHITTREAAQYVAEAGPTPRPPSPRTTCCTTATPVHGRVRPHYYCLPVLKREVHRQALVAAATSGSPRFFLGTDSAPHAAALKEQSGLRRRLLHRAGALELYAEAFDAAGALDRLEAFASHHGPDFYGLPRNTGTVTLRREPWQLPETLPFGDAQLKPLRGRRDPELEIDMNDHDCVMLLIDADNVSLGVMDPGRATCCWQHMARCTCAAPTAPPRARSSTSRPSSGWASSPWSTWPRARTAPTSRWRSTRWTWCWPSGPTWW
jgi:hypothetical protein